MVMPPAKWERRRQGYERRGVRSRGASRWSTGQGALWSSGTQYVQWGWGAAVASGAWAGQWPMKTQVWMCPPGAADGTRMPGLLSAVGPFQFLRKAGNLSPERDVPRKLAGGPGPLNHPWTTQMRVLESQYPESSAWAGSSFFWEGTGQRPGSCSRVCCPPCGLSQTPLTKLATVSQVLGNPLVHPHRRLLNSAFWTTPVASPNRPPRGLLSPR